MVGHVIGVVLMRRIARARSPPGVLTSTTSSDSRRLGLRKNIADVTRIKTLPARRSDFIEDGSIRRAGNSPFAGALATPISASRHARTAARTPGGKYTA